MPVLNRLENVLNCALRQQIVCPDKSSLRHHLWLFCCILGFLMNNGHTQSLVDVTFLMNCELDFLTLLICTFFSLSVMVVLTWYLFPVWERNYLNRVNFWFALFDALNNILMEKAAFTVGSLKHERWKNVILETKGEGDLQCTGIL